MSDAVQRAETRVLTDLQLEAGVEIYTEDNVMQHKTTGLVRPAEDLPDYELVGKAQNDASTIGKGPGTARVNALQGELYSDQDPAAPVKWPRRIAQPVYATGRRTVAETSTNKVFAGRAIEVDGNKVLHVLETTGQPS